MPAKKRRTSEKTEETTNICTYDLGYVRQDLFACRKCSKKSGRYFGFCSGCRESCHGDHLNEVFDLYTKRSFRCDCGNGRAKNKCCLQPRKDNINDLNENTYGHNFESRYCRCDREYLSTSGPMAQCAMCEDWFHEACFKMEAKRRGKKAKRAISSYDFVCKDCVRKLPLLADYYAILDARSTIAQIRNWHSARPANQCFRPTNVGRSRGKPGTVDLMFKQGFRTYLCRCSDCIQVYRDSNASYITDRSDFLGAYSDDDEDIFNDVADEDIIHSDDDEVLQVELVREKGDNSVQNRFRARNAFDSQKQASSQTGEVSSDKEVQPQFDSVDEVRNRILSFIHRKLSDDERQDSQEEVLRYISDLKADLVATFCQPGDIEIPSI